MLKIINKLFPFLSKSHDEIIDEKQYLQHWKTISHLNVNQISYLYNNFKLLFYSMNKKLVATTLLYFNKTKYNINSYIIL